MSLVCCFFRSFAHFLSGLFVFLLLSFKSSLNILETSPLSDMYFTNIFSPFCGLSFDSLKSVFHRAEVLNFNKDNILFHIMVYIVSFIIKPKVWDFPLFSSKSSIILWFIFRSKYIFSIFLLKVLGLCLDLFIFAYGCWIVSGHFPEKIILSPLNCLYSFAKIQLTASVWI